jgi:hypothetical protein
VDKKRRKESEKKIQQLFHNNFHMWSVNVLLGGTLIVNERKVKLRKKNEKFPAT